MQAYLWTRGIKDRVDNFINDLQAQPCRYVNNPKYPNSPYNWLQLSVRPVQFWELAFPKTSFKEVLKMVGYNPGTREELKYAFWALRKMLKAKEIPQMDLSKTPMRFIRNQYVGTYLVGCREDQIIKADEPRSKASPELIGMESI